MANEEFVTLDRSSPQFEQYLRGEFSAELRALPVRSMNINSYNERVTFQIFRTADIRRPHLIRVLAQVLRFDILTLTMTPAIVVAALVWNSIQRIDLLAFALASLFFLHGAVFCRNDFVDHMRGVDRLSEKGGSQVIQKGWLRAITVERLYRIFLVVAGSLAIPVFIAKPELLVLSALTAALGVLGYSHLRWGRGNWFLGDFAAFLCLGPFLTLGMGWLLTNSLTSVAWWSGFFFGGLALLYVQARHMISMVVDDEAGLITLPIRLGFDHAKLALIGLSLLAGVLVVTLLEIWHPPLFVFFELFAIILFFWVSRKASAISSPLSSSLYHFPRLIIRVHTYAGLALIFLALL